MSMAYRKQRIEKLSQDWGATKVNDLYLEWKIPENKFRSLKLAIFLYISKAFEFDFYEDEKDFLKILEKNKANQKNLTPNGGVVPKREYQLEFNMFLREWSEIVKEMIKHNPALLTKYRLTPNIRIKFGEELDRNVGRPLDTALPHSDAWVEGPWGMNCHVPVAGDCSNNYLHFFKLKNESFFSDKMLETAPTYTEMQWVLDSFEDDNIIPKVGFVSISDYALLHKTLRKPGCGTRISIDTTIFAGDHDVHPSRSLEYSANVPDFGLNRIFTCKLHNGEVVPKISTFSHYTSGNLSLVKIFDDESGAT